MTKSEALALLNTALQSDDEDLRERAAQFRELKDAIEDDAIEDDPVPRPAKAKLLAAIDLIIPWADCCGDVYYEDDKALARVKEAIKKLDDDPAPPESHSVGLRKITPKELRTYRACVYGMADADSDREIFDRAADTIEALQANQHVDKRIEVYSGNDRVVDQIFSLDANLTVKVTSG